jgi:hypothetical protein
MDSPVICRMGSTWRCFQRCLMTGCKPSNEEPGVKAIVGAVLMDGTGGPPISDSVVTIEGSRIRAVGNRASLLVPPEAEKIDGAGKFVGRRLATAQRHCTRSIRRARSSRANAPIYWCSPPTRPKISAICKRSTGRCGTGSGGSLTASVFPRSFQERGQTSQVGGVWPCAQCAASGNRKSPGRPRAEQFQRSLHDISILQRQVLVVEQHFDYGGKLGVA